MHAATCKSLEFLEVGGEGRNRTYPPDTSCRGNGFEDRDDHQARITLPANADKHTAKRKVKKCSSYQNSRLVTRVCRHQPGARFDQS
jgi:hypothetical protein